MAYGTDDNDNARHYGYDATGTDADDSPNYYGVSIGNPDPIREMETAWRSTVTDFPQKPIDYRPFVPPIFTYDPEPVVEPKKSPLERIADALEALVEQGKASAAPQTYITWNATTTPLFDYAEEGAEEEVTVGADEAVFVAAEDYWDQTEQMNAREGWEAGMLTKTDGRYPVGLVEYRYPDNNQKGYFYQVNDRGLEALGIERQ